MGTSMSRSTSTAEVGAGSLHRRLSAAAAKRAGRDSGRGDSGGGGRQPPRAAGRGGGEGGGWGQRRGRQRRQAVGRGHKPSGWGPGAFGPKPGPLTLPGGKPDVSSASTRPGEPP